MSRIYGIDLGTTNSVVALDGETITAVTPSIADLQNKTAGEALRGNLKVKRSFKVDMTSSPEGKVPMYASALVLHELKRLALEAGHTVERAVISVPAYFSESQRAATAKAAEIVGIKVERLINEPTAAAIAISEDTKGLYAIYDLGGGTYDISIIDSRFGIYDVLTFDGDRIGGDDIDKAIIRHIQKSLPFRLMMFEEIHHAEFKQFAEEAKIHISTTKTAFEFDFTEFPFIHTYDGDYTYTLSPELYNKIVRETLRPTAMRTKELVEEYIGDEPYFLALVGGSTKCPYVTQFIEEVVGQESIHREYNPDLIVGQGASKYGALVESGDDVILISDVTKAIGILEEGGTVRNIIPKNSKVPIMRTTQCTTDKSVSALHVVIYQGDSKVAEGNDRLGELVYPLSKMYAANEVSVSVNIEVTVDGLIRATVREPLQKEQVIIIQRDAEGAV